MLAGLGLTTAPVLGRAAREYRPVLYPGLYGKRETQQLPAAGQRLRRRDGDARQRQARPGPLKVNFSLYDAEGFATVSCEGIPPDLFREGAGGGGSKFPEKATRPRAHEARAKHDENYHPAGAEKAMVKIPPPATRWIRTLIMMPEYGHALLCSALGVARCCCPFTCCGAWARRRADDGVGRGVPAAVPICVAGAVFVLAHALWLTTSLYFLASPATEHAAAGVVPGWPPPGAHEGSLLGAADERLDRQWWCSAGRCRRDIVARVLAVMGMVCRFSGVHPVLPPACSPASLPAFPVEGRDLNPLLQDPG